MKFPLPLLDYEIALSQNSLESFFFASSKRAGGPVLPDAGFREVYLDILQEEAEEEDEFIDEDHRQHPLFMILR
jgi:hypothetical protein